MPGNKYTGNQAVASTRLERLLRERELRKSSKVSHFPNESTDNNRGNELSDHDFRQGEADNGGVSYVEQYLEGAALAYNEGWERPDGKPTRQRLLVVANRLPVSAVRRGEESWSLEISGGGLVSALLGKLASFQSFLFLHLILLFTLTLIIYFASFIFILLKRVPNSYVNNLLKV